MCLLIILAAFALTNICRRINDVLEFVRDVRLSVTTSAELSKHVLNASREVISSGNQEIISSTTKIVELLLRGSLIQLRDIPDEMQLLIANMSASGGSDFVGELEKLAYASHLQENEGIFYGLNSFLSTQLDKSTRIRVVSAIFLNLDTAFVVDFCLRDKQHIWKLVGLVDSCILDMSNSISVAYKLITALKQSYCNWNDLPLKPRFQLMNIIKNSLKDRKLKAFKSSKQVLYFHNWIRNLAQVEVALAPDVLCPLLDAITHCVEFELMSMLHDNTQDNFLLALSVLIKRSFVVLTDEFSNPSDFDVEALHAFVPQVYKNSESFATLVVKYACANINSPGIDFRYLNFRLLNLIHR